jgi:hypothetical protein
MKRLMATATAAALLAGMSVAYAQNPPASNNDKSDKTVQQPVTPKASASKHTSTSRHASAKTRKSHMRTTTGAGHEGTIGGPQNDPSIHQSIGRDSRGAPKNNGAQQ